MKAFIIGAAGFVGKHLIDHLRDDRKWSISVSKLPHEQLDARDVEMLDLDILDSNAVIRALQSVDADYVFHLAAQSSVGFSWKEPGVTIDVNIKGTVNILEALREVEPPPRILLIGSGEEYGHVLPREIPIREDTILRPSNIYAATKACQSMLGKVYADAYGLDIIVARVFNHIGPGQSPAFVTSDFCKQVAEIEAGLREPVIRVGNLSARRDFTDVHDIVRAYGLLIEHGKKGEVYNVGSGKTVSIDELLQMIIKLARVKITVETDEGKFRPVDVPMIMPDIEKLQEVTGWRTVRSLDDTVAGVLEYWREITGGK